MRVEQPHSGASPRPVPAESAEGSGLTPGTQRWNDTAVRFWPVLVTEAFLLFLLWTHATLNHFTRLTDFAQLGTRYATPFGLRALATSEYGYDGQFFYYMARFSA